MKTENALVAFCMTALFLIVGLVMLSAFQLGIASPALTGSYIGIPTMGRVSRESLPLVIPDVDASSPSCYQDGVSDCQRLNAGQNFIFCADRVALNCGLLLARPAMCLLPAGFELKYLTSRECNYGVIDECRMRCSAGMQEDCIAASKGRCSLIGGAFRNIRQQVRRTALQA